MTSNIRIVLISTSHPGNIGAVARAMKNMNLRNLHLVAPKSFPHADATARASGADDILAAAEVHAELDSAIAECSLVIGTSARSRSIAWPLLDPRQCAELVLPESKRHQVAILFGREHSGLSNAELDCCHFLVQIPTNPGFTSLNVASAVQIIAYELLVAGQHGSPGIDSGSEQLTTFAETELFYKALEEVLVEIEFLDPQSPKHLRRLMRRLRRLFNRIRLNRNEMNILRGILTAIRNKHSK
jgi:tRNA (cytidine32/uridine32-2'-O)-methyltransferase